MTQHDRNGSVDPRSAWATPLDAPMYPPYPLPFRDLELLTLQYRTDPAAIRRLLPEPLMPTGDTVLLHVARFGDVPGIGADVHECNVMIGARLDTPTGPVVGAYSPYFFLDNDRAVAVGREVQGQAKRLAEVRLETRGDLVVGTVRANGIDILTGTLPYKLRQAPFAELRSRVDMVTNINLKIVPGIDGTGQSASSWRGSWPMCASPSAGPVRAPSSCGRTRSCRCTGCRCWSSSTGSTGEASSTWSQVGCSTNTPRKPRRPDAMRRSRSVTTRSWARCADVS